MSKTEDNLKTAFAGESQANRKYLAYAHKAEQEKLPYVARMFRAVAEAETVHAHAHLRVLHGVGSTEENLKAAIGGETEEFTSMYPAMIAEAEAAGHKMAAQTFKYANAVEKVHADLFKKALDNPSQPDAPIYVCKVCGYTHEHDAPDKCPVCGAGSQAFMSID